MRNPYDVRICSLSRPGFRFPRDFAGLSRVSARVFLLVLILAAGVSFPAPRSFAQKTPASRPGILVESGMLVNKATGSCPFILEGGGDVPIVHLAARPAGNVTVTAVSSRATVRLSKPGGAAGRSQRFVFTPDDWNRAQRMNVTMEKDADYKRPSSHNLVFVNFSVVDERSSDEYDDVADPSLCYSVMTR